MIDQLFASDNIKVPLFRLAFRSFFLFGAMFSVLAMGIWLLSVNGDFIPNFYGGALFWHTHEMLFGFTAAIVAGFLLTAVQNWTGVKSVNGWPLFFLLVLWLVARIGFLNGDLLKPIWLASLDVAFLPMVALFLVIPIVRVKQWRNLFFVPVLLLFSVCNAMTHIGLLNDDHDLVIQGTRSVLMLISVLMVVIGGRVIPFFTANGTQTPRVAAVEWLEILALGFVWLAFLIHLLGLNDMFPQPWMAGLFLVAGLANLLRLVRWRFWITLKVALLWPLHLAYGFICLAFILLGMDLWLDAQTSSTSWHVLTVGGIGLLILSMVSRVSLGHTGRKLLAPKWMVPAFDILVVAVVFRTLLTTLFPEQLLLWLNLSGLAWIIAYGIFVCGYFLILTRPRIDQKPG